jgi:RimJ/RimL family protein N-acetyltransferase
MISSGAVTLRPVRADDLDSIYAIFADLDTWELRTPRPPAPFTMTAFRQWYAQILEGLDEIEFAITVQDRLVGRCTLLRLDPLARNAELGIALGAGERGQGYGTDAVRALVEFGFERRNLHRIFLEVLASNAPAVAAYRAAGFVEEGRMREQVWVRGSYADQLVMGLLRAEWRRARP